MHWIVWIRRCFRDIFELCLWRSTGCFSQTIRCCSRQPKQVFQAKTWSRPKPNQVAFVPEPKQSANTNLELTTEPKKKQHRQMLINVHLWTFIPVTGFTVHIWTIVYTQNSYPAVYSVYNVYWWHCCPTPTLCHCMFTLIPAYSLFNIPYIYVYISSMKTLHFPLF